ncbi:zinc-ribbon and DUF3426 domain-containing protein [Pseudazoarcus pumilus]|uniref:Zinc finger/thioredoxin putative domain-containing protein n=1 Tax=Pseudazoarcus pumilus TaxID=2067960 RepID=A0A2I6SB40_9RHOO|nr:zinc-ribbon and DUF3426 domain-containing protein [Pseudazoarcus pumilus]AUN96464.1 hypothetical protein C0099_12390 [Pseudazoarcus pumilus]
MSIARCPACLTAFRVGEDVLAQRGGRVRCGHCYRPFNALEHLVAEQPEEASPARATDAGLDFEIPERFGPPRSTTAPAAEPMASTMVARTGAQDEIDEPTPDDAPQEAPAPIWKALTPARAEAHGRNAFAASGFTRRVEEDDRVEPSLDGEPDLPPPATASIAAVDASMDTDDHDPIERWRERAYGPEPQPRRWAWALGVGMLLGTLVAQASFIYREPITREWPRLRPVYLQVCERLGCEMPLPRVLERLDVAATRLDPVPGSDRRFVLVAEIANLANHPQQLPHLELSLQDRDDHAVARRAFAPEEWLPADADPAAGIAAGSRLNVALPFETAEQARPAGFRVNLFYP